MCRLCFFLATLSCMGWRSPFPLIQRPRPGEADRYYSSLSCNKRLSRVLNVYPTPVAAPLPLCPGSLPSLRAATTTPATKTRRTPCSQIPRGKKSTIATVTRQPRRARPRLPPQHPRKPVPPLPTPPAPQPRLPPPTVTQPPRLLNKGMVGGAARALEELGKGCPWEVVTGRAG